MQCPSCRSEIATGADSCFHCGYSLYAGIKRGSLVGARYEILSSLGKGGMGVVYKAHDRVLDETVALKVLRADVTREPDQARRFRSEIKLARKARHRNVCGIHEYGEDGPLRFIAMEYVEGTDLKHELRRRGRLPPEEAFDVAIQCALGLEAIHEVGIIHRDLKTPNIMRDGRGQVRLMDFGIAKEFAATTGATATGHIVGTPDYMSPEQARGLKLDYRSDIYSLAIVIFELFTGSLPFRGDSPVVVIMKQIQEPPPLDAPIALALPQPLIPVLRKALAKERAERHGSVGSLLQALREAEAGWRSVAGRRLPPLQQGTSALALEPQPAPTEATPVPTPMPTPVPTPAPTSLAAVLLDLQARLPALVERGDLTAAETEIALARKRHGSAPGAEALDDLQRRVDAVRRTREEEQRRRQRAEALLNRGRELWGAGQLDEARLALQAALDTEPGYADAASLLVSVEATLEKQRQEGRRREQALSAARQIEGLLAQGSLSEAGTLLAAARLEHGEHEPLAALATRIAETQREREREQQRLREQAILQRKQEADALTSQGRLEEAQQALRAALEMDPGRSDLRQALQSLADELARRAEAQRRARAVSAAADTVEDLLAARKLVEARRELSRALRELGSQEALTALENRLRAEEDAERRRETEERSSRHRATAVAGIEALLAAGKVAETRRELSRVLREVGPFEALSSVETRLRAAEEGKRRRDEQDRLLREREREQKALEQPKDVQAPVRREPEQRLPQQQPAVPQRAAGDVRRAGIPVGLLVGAAATLVLVGSVGVWLVRSGLALPTPSDVRSSPAAPRLEPATAPPAEASPPAPALASTEPNSGTEAVAPVTRTETPKQGVAPRALAAAQPNEGKRAPRIAEESRPASAVPADGTAANDPARVPDMPPSPIAVPQPTPAATQPTPAAAPPTAAATEAVAAPAAPAEGMLQVVVRPWAEVSVDGVVVGMTPLNKVVARAGERVVRLTHPGFEPMQRTVMVRAGEVTKLEIDLIREGLRKKP